MIASLRCSNLRASAVRGPARGRSTAVIVRARGPIMTKKGVAFKKGGGAPEEEMEPFDDDDIGTAGLAAIALGLPANPLCYWSEFTLATTGKGLPDGPGGALGAAEGISYLVIVAIVAYSLYTKVATGRGLPPGPSGLLGAVEGLSYLALLGGIAAFAFKP
ncbi:hypothetical protein FOA52_008657 [Chlamydomonas sp. UWO 241]|nr:hypothetical protein FOA52_008657 [Chlamydomonas sp. UWO 241]